MSHAIGRGSVELCCQECVHLADVSRTLCPKSLRRGSPVEQNGWESTQEILQERDEEVHFRLRPAVTQVQGRAATNNPHPAAAQASKTDPNAGRTVASSKQASVGFVRVNLADRCFPVAVACCATCIPQVVFSLWLINDQHEGLSELNRNQKPWSPAVSKPA